MQKINSLILNWKNGTIKFVSVMVKEGISYALINNYKNNKWIEKIGNGAYKLYKDEVDIFSAVNALQEQINSRVHIGGKSALDLLGYSHFVPRNQNKLFLFGNSNDRLPTWMKNYNWEREYSYSAINLFNKGSDEYLTLFQHNLLSVKISSPELAVLEMLYHVPSEISFNEASLIINNLTTLRVEILQKLLEECNSVKVKRLFLYLADKHELPVFKKLKVENVNLGSGKRVIAENGSLDNKYLITVPKESYNEE
ncbi:TPA: hypothetical protein DCR49_00525 [Candidatus Delongbacteria bacterium]|nr:hypothetical protein [Candidatus Delongbacteria bacterium]